MPITALISPFEMDFKKGGGRECFREEIEIDFFFFLQSIHVYREKEPNFRA